MEKSSYSPQSQSASGTFSGRSMSSPEVDQKSKIAELEQTIRQNELKIGELTDKLTVVQAKLKERDEAIEEYAQGNEELEQQLSELQKRLETTKNSSLDLTASDVSTREHAKCTESFHSNCTVNFSRTFLS